MEVQNWFGPLPDEALAEEPTPAGFDWDLFLGQAPSRPHHWRYWLRDQREYNGARWPGWDMWRDYSGHLMNNWGAHAIDMVQWALGIDDAGPVEIPPLMDQFEGERGEMKIVRNGFTPMPRDLVRENPDVALREKWMGKGFVARLHLQNWIDCIRSRQDSVAPVEVGHRSATVCHLAGIARELKRKLRWNPVAETFPDDAQANALVDRPKRDGWELPT